MPEYGNADFDQRKFPRLDYSIPMAFELAQQKLPDGITANLSLGGMLVFLPHSVSPGQVMEITLRLPSPEGEHPFKARAEVVWAQDGDYPGGFTCQAGLRFFEMSPKSFNVWKAFLTTYFEKPIS